MIRAQVSLHYQRLLLPSQLVKYLSKVFPEGTVNLLSAPFGNENDMILAIPFRVVYSRSLKFRRNGAGFCVFIFPIDEPSESLGQPVNELVFGFCIEARKPLGLHNKPEPFNGIQIR